MRRVLDLSTPDTPLEQLRWGLVAVDSLLALLAIALLAGQPTGVVTAVGLVAVSVTILHWLVAARTGRLPWTTDLAVVIALWALGHAMGPADPGMAFSFAAMTVRALYPHRLERALVAYPVALATGWTVSEGLTPLLSPPALIGAASLILVGIMFRAVVRSMEEHDGTRAALQQTRSELERRVADRTRELAETNRSLEEQVREVEATQALLQRSEEYYRSLIEHGSDIVVVLRPDGRIRYATPSVERVLGYGRSDLRDRPFVEFVHEDDLVSSLETFNDVMEEPDRVARLRVRVPQPDGGARHLEAVAQNLVEMPSVAGVVFTARDVTDRIEVEAELAEQEAQLRQAQKMEAVGRLAGGVAHDFNNILTAIGGHAEYMEARLPAGDALAAEVEGIGAAVDRAGRLTRQLLVFSRREVSRPEVLDPNEVVRGIEGLVRRLIPEPIEPRLTLSSRRWRLVADAGHLEQVILNLVVNARDAMPEGGTVTVSTADVSLRDPLTGAFAEIPAGDYVRVAVQDTGCGIDAATLERIFDPFYTTKGTGGTGLGLSTVFGITRDAGAEIRVESVVGEGSRFEVYFPATEAEPTPGEAPVETGVEGAGETLLLVEDEDPLRALTARGLRERGFVVLSAATGEDAVRMAELYRAPIDLLVTDVVMPGMNGLALHRELEDRLGRLPVLFVSGYPGEELSRRGLETGRLLPKPYRTRELAVAIRGVLDEG